MRQHVDSNRHTDDAYEIRRFRPGDREGYRSLYATVFESPPDGWFRWKYEDNPYVDHVPIILATVDGEVVGAKPCFALELRAGDRTVTALQPADVVVHPDHRRRGLYSRTTELMKRHYRENEPALFFNFPNAATLEGSLKHGWRIVQQVPTYYRIQKPSSLMESNGSYSRRVVARAGELLWNGYASLRRGVPSDRSGFGPSENGSNADESVTVESGDGVPPSTFASVYNRSVPETFHAHRDERFYSYRFGNPRWQYRHYLARSAGDPVAGAIAGTRPEGTGVVTYLSDVVPLAPAPGRAAGLAAIFEAIERDHRDSTLIAVSGQVVPSTILRNAGYLPDRGPLLSRITDATTHVTYPIAHDGGHEWCIAGLAVADPTNWTMTFAEQDSS